MDVAGDRTLYSVFAAAAARQPGREWLVYERGDGAVLRWSYADFLASVHRATNLLDARGVGPGDAFALRLGNHPAYPQLILAASLLGAIAVPINPASSADEAVYVVDHSGSAVVFDDEAAYEAELERQPTTPPPDAGAAERVVQLLYTSGTTARPKGVMVTNAGFVYAAEVHRAATGLREEDRHLIALPLFHAAAQCHALWPSLIAGGSVALMARFSASRFFEQAARHGGTMAALFGAPLRMLLAQPERPTDRAHALRNVTFAQNLTAAQYEEWHRRFGAPLQQLWGMTETCGLPVMSPLTGERNLLAMGRPVLGYELKVVDADAREVPVGAAGELIVRGTPGRTVMAGYLKNPEATAATLRTLPDGTWLFSGDTVRADADGFLYFVDRGKDLIKRAGENISSVEVEAVILDCPGVLDACVVGVPDPLRDEAVVAAVVRRPDAEVTAEQVRAHCAARLASFKVPERVVFLDALPRTSVGKVQKQLVREQLLGSS